MEPFYTKLYREKISFNVALGYAYESLVNGPYAFDAMAVWKSLSERIAQGIYMGEGLLLPHTRVAGLQAPLMAFVVSREGFTDIKIPRDEKTCFMCLLLSPLESAMAHTTTIAQMAKRILDKDWRDNVLKAENSAELLRYF